MLVKYLLKLFRIIVSFVFVFDPIFEFWGKPR